MISPTDATKKTNAEYHADYTHYSHSMLKVFRQSPALFEAYYVARTLTRPGPTPAMQLGSLVHALVLEPEEFDCLYMVAEGCDSRRGNKWKSAVDAASDMGVEAVLPSQLADAREMAKAVHNHPLAAKLLSLYGVAEQPIRWTGENDLPLKCKPDWLAESGGDYMLNVDFKTSLDPSPSEFAKQAYNLGYHRGMAHYSEGCAHSHDRPIKSIFIVVGNAQPHDVYVYQPDNDFLRLGEFENTETLAALDNCLRSGTFRATDQNELQTLYPPKWARRKE